jgi:hypothetical protein
MPGPKMKHRTVFKKLKEDYVEEDYDEDLEELRWHRFLAELTDARDLLWWRYFYRDSTCREHDSRGCRECNQHARGRITT